MSLKDIGENKSVESSYATVQLDQLERLIERWKPAVAKRDTESCQSYVSQYRDVCMTNSKILSDMGRRQDATLNERHSRLMTEGSGLMGRSVILLAQAGVAGFLGGVVG